MTLLPNEEAPYLHWHIACAKCHKITLAVARTPPNAIALLTEDPGVRCQHRHHTQTYLRSVCFLAPISTGVSGNAAATKAVRPRPEAVMNGKSGSTLAVMIAAMRLAQVSRVSCSSRVIG